MSDHHDNKNGNEKAYWLDKTKNINLLIWVLGVACAVVFAADAFYVRHVYFEPEGLFGFIGIFGIYGFVCFVFIVFAGKALRMLVMRDEDYYDR